MIINGFFLRSIKIIANRVFIHRYLFLQNYYYNHDQSSLFHKFYSSLNKCELKKPYYKQLLLYIHTHNCTLLHLVSIRFEFNL